MAKRLRGWELELATGRVAPDKQKRALGKAKQLQQSLEKDIDKDPISLEKDEKPSALANKLLALWAQGMLSAVLIREIAHLALQDGAQHNDLVALARTGNWGAQPGNAHRQILNHFCKDILLPESHQVKVNCLGKDNNVKEEDASVFLPHLLFWKIGKTCPALFQKLWGLGKDCLQNFWKTLEKVKEEKLTGHPMTLEKDWKNTTIPLFIHGDGVEFQSRDSLLVFSWGGLLNRMSSSLESHFLLAAFPKSSTSNLLKKGALEKGPLEKGTWPPIWEVLKWSFEALAAGRHPSHGPDHKPLEKGSLMCQLRGQPLHPDGYKAVVWSIQGDHEFFSNVLGLPHWSSHYPCWECDAENFADATLGKEFKQIALEKADFRLYSHAECLAEPWSEHQLFQLPGVSSHMVRGDPLHILFCKGLYSHLLGGLLHYLCWFEGPGKTTQKKPWERLALIFQHVQGEYSKQGIASRLTNLRLSMFTDPKKPWAKNASLDCKGAEARHLLPALLPVLKLMLSLEKDEALGKVHEQMLCAAESLEKLVSLWDGASTILTAAEYEESLALGKAFLDAYLFLHHWSLEKDRCSFHIVAKHHTFIHLLWNSRYLNPRMQWCFKGEDFVGQISKLTHSISMGVSSTRLSLKVAPKYRVLLHFKLTRPELDLSTQLDEE